LKSNFVHFAVSTVTMLELRRDAAGIIRRLQKGESFQLSYRGRAVGRLEPIATEPDDAPPRRMIRYFTWTGSQKRRIRVNRH
jgi:antitoxin (DNA-binding transcriptional repressor) of toxin-antitoxin stability system